MYRVERITGWLCLILTLLTGAVPARSFVVCIEPDGRVSLEAADAAGKCGACEPHGFVASRSPVSAVPALDAACPCVDVTVAVSVQDPRAQPKRFAPTEAWPATLLPSTRFVRPMEPIALSVRPDRLGEPVPDRWTLIRSVVLLV